MDSFDLNKIIELNKEFFDSKDVSNKEFLGDSLFDNVWNSKGYIIENVGVSFIINTLRNGSNISDDDKVKIFNSVFDEWMKEVINENKKKEIV